MKKLTHADRRNKARRMTPAMKRRRARTTTMHLRAIGVTKRFSHPSALARTIEKNKLNSVDANGRRLRVHKARRPGTVRVSRMVGGSGFRNNWETASV